MTGADRNWDKELAEIDKLIAAQPAAPAGPPAPRPAPAGAAPASAPPARARRSLVGAGGTWFRVLLAAALAAALPFYPAGHYCGLQLGLYLGAVGMLVLAGAWGAVSAWRRQLGLAHVVALLALGAGLVYGAAEVLPRVGYARVSAPWSCP